jgi:phage terminase large subunit-like protein
MEVRRNKIPIDFFSPQKYQNEFFISNRLNKTIFGGNRSGKTICGASYVIEKCRTNPNFKARCSTWADLQVSVQMTKVFELLPKNNEITYAVFSDRRGFSNKIISFANGSSIRFKTYDQGWESFQGGDYDLEWNDEEAPEDIVKEQRARLIDRAGEFIRTMTPLNGITYTYEEVVENEKNDDEIVFWYFPTEQNDFINQSAFKRIINSYGSKEAEVRSTGHFINLTSGQVYYSFSDKNIIPKNSYQYQKNRPLEISCDFNVDIMSWNISQEHQMKDYIFDYVELEGQANTQVLCDMIKNKFVGHQGGYIFYGDISGSARRPETSKTNWTIISENFPSAKIYYQNIKNIKDRTDSLNARLKNNSEIENLFVSKNCIRLIRDLRQVTWEHLINKAKAKKLTHISDGLSYMTFWKYPLSGKGSTFIHTNEPVRDQKAHAIGWRR